MADGNFISRMRYVSTGKAPSGAYWLKSKERPHTAPSVLIAISELDADTVTWIRSVEEIDTRYVRLWANRPDRSGSRHWYWVVMLLRDKEEHWGKGMQGDDFIELDDFLVLGKYSQTLISELNQGLHPDVVLSIRDRLSLYQPNWLLMSLGWLRDLVKRIKVLLRFG